MELKWIYKGEECYSAPTDFIEGIGMVSVWEEEKCFVILPTKMAIGRGEVPNHKHAPKFLPKTEWEGVYVK